MDDGHRGEGEADSIDEGGGVSDSGVLLLVVGTVVNDSDTTTCARDDISDSIGVLKFQKVILITTKPTSARLRSLRAYRLRDDISERMTE